VCVELLTAREARAAVRCLLERQPCLLRAVCFTGSIRFHCKAAACLSLHRGFQETLSVWGTVATFFCAVPCGRLSFASPPMLSSAAAALPPRSLLPVRFLGAHSPKSIARMTCPPVSRCEWSSYETGDQAGLALAFAASMCVCAGSWCAARGVPWGRRGW